MPKVDIASVPIVRGTGYPAPFDAPCAERTRRRLGEAGGLTEVGVNLMHLPPGGWSSQRHFRTRTSSSLSSPASSRWWRTTGRR